LKYSYQERMKPEQIKNGRKKKKNIYIYVGKHIGKPIFAFRNQDSILCTIQFTQEGNTPKHFPTKPNSTYIFICLPTKKKKKKIEKFTLTHFF
jgi:hypothetical protein